MVHGSHTRTRAPLDVEEQARPAQPLVPPEFGVGTGADWVGPQEKVEGLPDRTHVWIRSEVSDTLPLAPPHHRRPGPLVVHGHRQPWIALVVFEPHIEPGLGLFDQVVLE